MNSSDEAVEARLRELIEAVRAEDDPTFGSVDSVDNLIAAEVAWIQARAAAARAEAVADAERAIREAAASVLPPDGLTERFDLAAHSAFTLAVAAVHELAAGSVPGINQNQDSGDGVATPPAEPCEWFRSTPESEAMLTDERAHVAATEAATPARCQGFTIRERPDHQPLGPCIHCGKIYQQHRAPSQPVTCEHGRTEAHNHVPERRKGRPVVKRCPGPVSVPKESSE